jgi:hypothetical protein
MLTMGGWASAVRNQSVPLAAMRSISLRGINVLPKNFIGLIFPALMALYKDDRLVPSIATASLTTKAAAGGVGRLVFMRASGLDGAGLFRPTQDRVVKRERQQCFWCNTLILLMNLHVVHIIARKCLVFLVQVHPRICDRRTAAFALRITASPSAVLRQREGALAMGEVAVTAPGHGAAA